MASLRLPRKCGLTVMVSLGFSAFQPLPVVVPLKQKIGQAGWVGDCPFSLRPELWSPEGRRPRMQKEDS